MTCIGAGCGGNIRDRDYSEIWTFPVNVPSGPAVMRWIWSSLETPEIYAHCVDINIVGVNTSAGESASNRAGIPDSIVRNAGSGIPGTEANDEYCCCVHPSACCCNYGTGASNCCCVDSTRCCCASA
jgi:hypothetical protein